MQAVQGHFAGKRTKVPLELALRTEAHPRNAEKWLAGGGMDSDNFIELLRSDIGAVVLAGALGDDPTRWPAWYAQMRKSMQLASVRKALAAQQRALEALEREAAQ